MSVATHTLRTKSLVATFRLAPHLLGVSLCHRGEELLRNVSEIEHAAQFGHPCGIPLLHPWANRLERPEYHAAGEHVLLDMSDALLRSDSRGLPLHGVPWSLLHTVVEDADERSFTVRIDWDAAPLLTLFPFRHSLRVTASVHDSTLTIATFMRATGDHTVPVSFGFHPYLGLPGPRAAWRISMPELVQLPLDHRGIPVGASDRLAGMDFALADASFDDAFRLPDSCAEFSIADRTRRISVQCVEGFSHAQVYAPVGQDFVCFEPMTAPVNALRSGIGLRTVAPGEEFGAAFRIVVHDVDDIALSNTRV